MYTEKIRDFDRGALQIFGNFFEVGGVFAFSSEKMGSYNYKTYFKQGLDSLRHEKRKFSRHNDKSIVVHMTQS